MIEYTTVYHGVPYTIYMKEKNHEYFDIKIGGITYHDIYTDLMKNKKYTIYPILIDLFKSEENSASKPIVKLIESMNKSALNNVFHDIFYMDIQFINKDN